MPAKDDRPPANHLPLTAVVFAILLALADGEKHGYGIMKAAAQPQGGALVMGPGTLYGSLDRLVLAGFVEETGTTDNERRRYYRITALGGQVLTAEISRLSRTLATARRRGIAQEAG